jgi:hypothetical protein
MNQLSARFVNALWPTTYAYWAVLILLSVPAFSQDYTPEDIQNRHTVAYPLSRLQRDWVYQDHGLKHGECFVAAKDNQVEHALVRKVLAELKSRNVAVAALEKSLAQLGDGKKPGRDPAWKSLYFQACELRRRQRLKVFDRHPREFVFAKHFVFGDCQAMFAMTDHLTDAVFRECGADYRMNSQLCKMRINADGTVATELLLDCPAGVVRDPCVSCDGRTLAFSMRRTSHDGDDDFHLYVMNLTDRSVRQITFGAGTADMEPEWLPNGELVFTSTRCVFSAPCWWSSVCNLFTCDAAGRYIRRLACDHGHTVFPHLTADGRIMYTRWEYSDRTAGYLHSLFVMNPDGTNQAEFYGNNSQFPAALLHARDVPNSTKVIAISGAHHIDQRGKLIMIDRNVGTQAGFGVKLLAPERDYPYREGMGTGGNVVHDTEGEQFQYPYPLDEDNYVVCYSPEGGPVRGLKGIKDGKAGSPSFGIYWMNRRGQRELLIYDPVISSGQQVPLTRPQPLFHRSTAVDEHQTHGRFYVQNIYSGPGLTGVQPGTVKRIRVVGLDYRAKGTVALGLHPWGGHQTSPCAINNGSYEVKHVLGTVDVEEDGSCCFECPSRVPVYFQMLDAKGRMVQNMRSWTMVLPGEAVSCIGCHEDKRNTYRDRYPATIASKRPPQKIKPFFAKGAEMRQIYLYFEAKRLKSAELELEHIDKYLQHVDHGADFAPAAFRQYTFGGRRVQQQFIDDYDRRPATVPIYGLAEGKDARGGSNAAGNEVRNLAVNKDAYTYHLRSYPRAKSNSHYRYRPEFSPNHAIDGQRTSDRYWRPARRTDVWLQVEFGREVETEKVVLVLHQHDGQAKTWTGATLGFSSGKKVPIQLRNTSQPQEFSFPKQNCVWVKLVDFRESFPLGDNGIAEFEVYGKDL